MSYIVNFTVEFDTEAENVAERFTHRLFETVLDEDYVTVVRAEQPVKGSIDVDD